MPVAAAWLPWYRRLLEMSTRPGRTALMTARSVELGTAELGLPPELPPGPLGMVGKPPPLPPFPAPPLACGLAETFEVPFPEKYAVTPAPAAAATMATIR